MMNGTSSKNKYPEKRLQSLEKRGFIRLFVLIVIVVGLLIYFGLDPIGVWENLLKPIIEWGFKVIVNIIGFFVDIAVWLLSKVSSILGI